AIKRIIEGTQSMTVFFNCREMSGAAWEAAVKIARGQDPGATMVEDDGTYAVPTLPFPVTQITRDNYHEELIASGFFKESDFR
ncbi:MAG: ATPase, partial [Treponema sp.]|nr:ATPase [Treponema sp.]